MWKAGLAVALAAAVGGCGTIVRGSTEDVTVNTEPSGAQVRTSLGHTCPASPCTFKIDRKAEFVVTATRDGYVEQSTPVGTQISKGGGASFAGNIVAGGVIGMGVDAATGAALNHYPNPVFMQLQPAPAREPVPPKARKPPAVIKAPSAAPGV